MDIDNQDDWLECELCGKKSSDVSLRKDPYADEIYNKEVYYTVCDDCDDESLGDI